MLCIMICLKFIITMSCQLRLESEPAHPVRFYLFIPLYICVHTYVFLIYLRTSRIANIDQRQMVKCVQIDTNKCKITNLKER